MGGAWDATNVADATVAVITPIAVDHAKYLGSTPGRHRPSRRPASSSPARPSSRAVQAEDVAAVIAERCAEVGATWLREGLEFGVDQPGAGGRRPDDRRCRGCAASYDEVFLPLYGAHQAQNAVARAGRGRGVRRRRRPLDADLVREALRRGDLAGPARGHPAQPDDRARRRAQPARRAGHGRRARGLVHVLPADRRRRGDGRQGLRGRARARSSRRWPHDRLHPELHRPLDAGRGAGRGGAAASSASTGCASPRGSHDAIDQAATLAEEGGVFGEAIGSGGVLVTGSVVTVGEARRHAQAAGAAQVTPLDPALDVRRRCSCSRRSCCSSPAW